MKSALFLRFNLVLAAYILMTSLHGQGATEKPVAQTRGTTAYPVNHVVVIFQENVSFDHYFATYPLAANLPGEPSFHARRGTPSVNGLDQTLLTKNPNALQPHRIGRAHVATADQEHDYAAEQQALDHGLMDQFVKFTGSPEKGGPSRVMDYFDGNVVTALWNYAQYYAMSDNSYGTTFGPSTPGALNLIAGNTHGATPTEVPNEVTQGTVIGDPDPAGDMASSTNAVRLSGRHVGDLLSAHGVTWGWFQGGFGHPSQLHLGSDGHPTSDFSAHHEPFQYFDQTLNANHRPPTSVAMIGRDDQAKHQYDLEDFWKTLSYGNLPAVSFLKAPAYQDGHAGYSDPLAEQQFLVETLNRLLQSKDWPQLAIIIAYDDSDGWYDHAMPPIVNHSRTEYDVFTGQYQTGANPPLAGWQGRAGHGPRLPLLVISPYAKENFVDHAITDQSSILRFIEDNWGLGRIGGGSFDELAGPLLNLFDFEHPHPERRLLLDARTGEPLGGRAG